MALLLWNAGLHYLTQICRLIWSSYEASQTIAGNIFITVTFLGSVVCGIGSGAYQGNCEGQVRKANPGMFPPTPLEYALEAWKESKEADRAVGKRASLVTTVVDVVAAGAARMSRMSVSSGSAASARPSMSVLSSPRGGPTPSDPDRRSDLELGHTRHHLKYEHVEEVCEKGRPATHARLHMRCLAHAHRPTALSLAFARPHD